MLEREFTESVNTTEEGGTIMNKTGGNFCAATGGVNLGGRGGTKSKSGLHGMGGRNDVVHRSVSYMVGKGNTSWERMSGSVIMAVRRDGLCRCRRESAISILLILTPRKYSCRILDLFRMKKDSSIRTKVSGSWRAACSQRSRKGFLVIQDELTQPRASIVFWSASATDGRGMLSDSVTVWWLGRVQHKGISMLEQRLRVLFGDPKGVLE